MDKSELAPTCNLVLSFRFTTTLTPWSTYVTLHCITHRLSYTFRVWIQLQWQYTLHILMIARITVIVLSFKRVKYNQCMLAVLTITEWICKKTDRFFYQLRHPFCTLYISFKRRPQLSLIQTIDHLQKIIGMNILFVIKFVKLCFLLDRELIIFRCIKSD